MAVRVIEVEPDLDIDLRVLADMFLGARPPTDSKNSDGCPHEPALA
jgi:hypothetical protein